MSVRVKAQMDYYDSQLQNSEGVKVGGQVKKGEELTMSAALADKYERIGYVKRVEPKTEKKK